MQVELAVTPGIATEGFTIADVKPGVIRIAGGDQRGVLYGVGKFLHASRYDQGGFTPAAWRGSSAPKKTMRGIYFATHFGNFYHVAPIEEVQQYVEELGLWGFNSLMIWYDMRDFAGFDDPKAVAYRQRVGQIFQSARDIGMGTTIGVIANEGDWLTPPAPVRKHSQRGDYGERYICPNAPGGMDCLTKVMTAEFAWAKAFQPEYLVLWPYDPGGCDMRRVAPWGTNGYLKCAHALALLGKKQLPGVKIIVSTWFFDGAEWKGLQEKWRVQPGWADVVMAEGRGDSPGGLPLVGFPEISMRGMSPWGGFGANPAPRYVNEEWNCAEERPCRRVAVLRRHL